MGGSLPHKWGSAAQRRARGKGYQAASFSTKTHFFFPFLESDRERTEKKNVHLEHLITPLPERISRRRRTSGFFLRLSWVGTQDHEILGPSRHSGQGSPRLGARDAENSTICPTKRTISKKQEQLETAVDASHVLGGLQRLAATAFLWRLRGFRRDLFSPQRYVFVNLVGRRTAFSHSSLMLILASAMPRFISTHKHICFTLGEIAVLQDSFHDEEGCFFKKALARVSV